MATDDDSSAASTATGFDVQANPEVENVDHEHPAPKLIRKLKELNPSSFPEQLPLIQLRLPR
jgi:hypothetical protein